LFNVNEQISKYANSAPYQHKDLGEKTMLDMAKTYDLPWENHKLLVEYCNGVGIKYMASCFDKRAVDFLINDLSGDCVKVGSGELTNYPLLQYISKTGMPIILSTGMSNLEDVRRAVSHIHKHGPSPLILLHCVSNYPASEVEINLTAMVALKNEFNLHVGYSDHTEGNTAAIAAVALGAKMIEKHFTINKNLLGPDHSMSLEPKELEEFVKAIRMTEAMLGDGIKKPTKAEQKMQIYARRSVVSSKIIKVGEKLDDSSITLKRPATGIDPRQMDKIIGKKAIVGIPADKPITWDMLE